MKTLLLVFLTLPLMAQAPAAQAPPPEAKPDAQQAGEKTGGQPAQQQQQAVPKPAAENWISGDIEVGYRFLTDVRGDFNTYRSVVNLGEGPKLFNADFTILPTGGKFADRIDVRASSWGDPYNTFRLDARKARLYNLTLDYRNIAYFNFLPSFANPGRLNPALPFLDQYGFDIYRRTFDGELDLFPSGRIVPYVAYSRNGGRGTGTTNFVLQSDEYTVPARYSDHTNEARGGVRFAFNRWHATLEGGSFNFRDDQEVFQGSQLPNLGNVITPILGQQLEFTGGREKYGIRGGGSFARAQFTANPVSWADVSAQFLYSQPHNDINFTQSSTGNLVDLATATFYNAEIFDVTGSAKQPRPSGSVSLVLRPISHFRIFEAWSTDRLHTAGFALLADQFLITGQAPTVQNLADATRFVVNYNQEEINLLYDVTRFLSVRGGYRYVWGDMVTPPSFLADAAGLLSERGVLRRQVGLAGLNVRVSSKVKGNVDFEASPGDRSYFRTSLNDYKRARIMASYNPTASWEFSARFNVLNNQNPDPAIRYDFESRDNTFTAAWHPSSHSGMGVLAEYSRSTLNSSIIYLIPSMLSQDFSKYIERANIGTLLADLPFMKGANPVKLSFGGSFYRSAGSRPTRFWQPMARFTIPIGGHVAFNTEWRYYGMTQPFYIFEGFRSHQFTTSLRFTI